MRHQLKTLLKTFLKSQYKYHTIFIICVSIVMFITALNTHSYAIPDTLNTIPPISLENLTTVPETAIPPIPEQTPEPEPTQPQIPLYNIPLSSDLQAYTYSLCQEYNLNYELVLSVMWAESKLNPLSIGHNSNNTKDSGLMQINSKYEKSWATAYCIENFNVLDSKMNIYMGIRILADRQSYWIGKGYSADKLTHAILGSFHSGVAGYISHVRYYGYKSSYATKIINYSNDLQTLKTFSDFAIDKK